MKHSSTHADEARSAGRLETLLLLALFIFGIWGIIQVFGKRSGRDSDRIETMVSLPATLNDDYLYTSSQGNAHLDIRPAEEGGVLIHFRIRSFNENARYILEFGDGAKLEMKGSSTTYAYAGAGQYRVRLKCLKGEKAEELYNDVLRIKPTGELAQNSSSPNFY